jgi:hypothetical protein
MARGHAVTVHARSAVRARQVEDLWNGADAAGLGAAQIVAAAVVPAWSARTSWR